MSLNHVLARADIWRARDHALQERGKGPAERTLPTGFEALDARLSGGGWPLGALTEVLFEHPGMGELHLFMSALARLSREGRYLAWVTPPHLPYAPALDAWGVDLSRLILIRPATPKDGLWAMEQVLRCRACGALLAWLERPRTQTLRRLQLAAQTGRTLGILFRPHDEAGQASPAALRLRLEGSEQALKVNIIKRRGGWDTRPVVLARHAVA